jgi:argininosuccinate synthase
MPKKKIILAYSGGLDTSVIIRWLIEEYDYDVIAYIADLGQEEPLQQIKKKALESGAVKAELLDLREEFVRDFVWPMLRGNAFYQEGYLLGTSIARPLIAKEQVRLANKYKTYAVCHGATGKGNDQMRFELTYYALNPKTQVIAPWREWTFGGRKDLIAYAKQHGIPVPVTKSKPYSMDRNLYHLSFEGGVLEDPWNAPLKNMCVLTQDPEMAPSKAQELTLDFKKGDLIKINGKKGTPAQLLAKLNKVAGMHGVGRVDIVEDRFTGMKSRGVYETPGGTVIHIARRALESLTVDRETRKIRDGLIPDYAAMIYNGFWYAPERETLQTYLDKVAEVVNGTVRVKLYKGNCTVNGRKSPNSLFSAEHATFEKDSVYKHSDAEGFIQLNALRLKIRALQSR